MSGNKPQQPTKDERLNHASTVYDSASHYRDVKVRGMVVGSSYGPSVQLSDEEIAQVWPNG